MTIGFITLDVDEQALFFDHQGRARIEEGPKRIFLWRERYRLLTRYTADQNAYLIITYRNGKKLHKAGPCVEYMNPQEHAHIDVEHGINLDANEVLVVYKQDETTKQVERYLEHGPTLFIPSASEWLHSFCWHGTDPQNKTQMVPAAHKFTKLRVIPDQFYYNVPEVRTADDAQIRIKLMMFYEMNDIERMLIETDDPKADFINCMTADVVAYTSSLTYMEFVERCGDLNDLKQYPQLLERCKKIGFNVTNIVFRGYRASPKLQELHDAAIKRRTEITLAREKQEQEQVLTDMKLKGEMERISLEHSLEIGKLQHRHKIKIGETTHCLEMEKAKWTEEFRQLRQNKEAQREAKMEAQAQELDHYEKLRGLDVCINDVVVSENPLPAKVVRIVGTGTATNVHLHQSGILPGGLSV